ncbi:MAG: hypothetical protein OEN50_01655 [Deltaproteobacteria bacterium]|nr:hypothetical protein [Deltaproteobacteria bacterium]
MVIRISSAALTLAGLLALISGLLFWTGAALNLISMHMMLGLLAVAALWIIGIAQAISQGGSWIIAAAALIVGAMMIALGLNQASLMVGEYHWVIQITHLMLGVLTIGVGHIGAARYRRGSAK